MEKFQNANLRANTLIFGFTGAIGSGCTMISRGLKEFYKYDYYGLSEPLHNEAKQRGKEDSFENLQNIGNTLRKDEGNDVLVRRVLESADQKWGEYNEDSKPKGIIIDGIRNVGEIEFLRQFPNFYLISIQSDRGIRKSRLCKKVMGLGGSRCKDKTEFEEADKRDSEEKAEYGQQVNQCNYFSDIVINNDGSINPNSQLSDYVHNKLYKRYIQQIENIVKRGEPSLDFLPTEMEAMMTSAYVQSRRSSCLKRKVGAIISTSNGEIIASGYNDVPLGAKTCYEDERYHGCLRDFTKEQYGQKYLFCPKCGSKIVISVECTNCLTPIEEYTKKCPNCKNDPDIAIICDSCHINISKEFFPGGSKESGKLLDVCQSLHAEENAILSLVKSGRLIQGDATLYTTTYPCNLCANKIVAAGLKKVVFSEPYVTDKAEEILKGENIETVRFEGVKSSAYFKLFGRISL